MRRVVSGIGSVAILLAAGGGYAPPPMTAEDSGPWPTTLAQDSQLSDFEQKAEAAGALGFYRDDVTASLVVLVPAAKSAELTLAKLGPAPVPISIKISNIDPGDLKLASDKLASIGRGELSAGETMAYFFNPGIGLIEVDAPLDPAVMSGLLGSSSKLVDYHQDAVVPAGRFNDVAPFWGAGALNFLDWQYPDWDCTAGFAVINSSGQKGLISAGHCGLVGHGVATPQGVSVGTLTAKRCQESNTDVGLITGKTYDNFIYVGTTQAGSGAEVTQAGTPAVGATYNFSGAAGMHSIWEHSNQLVLSITGSFFVAWCGEPGMNMLNLIVFKRTQGNLDVCDVDYGDSGGPFYFKWNGPPPTVGIRGIVNAFNTNRTRCYGVQYNQIKNAFGYSVYVH